MPFAHHGSVELYYETFGDPSHPALLLVNGLGSQCINYRTEWCEQFAARGFFTIRFDNRDVGLSTKFDHVPPDFGGAMKALAAGEDPPVAYRLADMAGDAVAVLDALGIDRAHVMGLSMGGMIVQQMAIDHAERLLTMTSVMSTHRRAGVRAVLARGLRHPDRCRRPPTGTRPSSATCSASAPSARRRTTTRPCTASYAAEAFDRCFNPDGVARQMIGITVSGPAGRGPAPGQVPTLVLHGDADTLIDISGGRRTAELIPGARFEVMEGMGHDYPPAYWERWVDLVAEHALAPGPDARA